MDGTEATATDRELVLRFRPAAFVESRVNSRTRRSQYRIACAPTDGRRSDLGPWCATEGKAWAAACLRLGLRLRSDRPNDPRRLH
jgi:hypothetical protein